MKKKIKLSGIITLVVTLAVIISFQAGCEEEAVTTVTSVTVSPATASVAKGATKTFTATVAGTNNPAQTVTWSIVQTGKNSGTTINSSGLLTVAAAETLTSLTVKATSTADNTKSGTAAVTITGTSPGDGGGPAADFTGFTGATLTISSKDQETAKANGYDYELWSQDKRGPATMVLGKGGGGTFKCEWSNGYNVLARAGKKYNETQTHSEIGTISVEFNASKFSVTGDVGYLSVYGWITGGTGSATTSANLVEYYIVENYNSYNPGSAGTSKGTVTIDGAQYTLYERAMTNAPSIKSGITSFTQYLSVRAPGSKRSSGTISVSEHFKAWNDAGMTKVNGKMYEVALKVEGWNGSNASAASAEINKNILSINGVPIQ
jgi:endo-1,4-beta-xylanase